MQDEKPVDVILMDIQLPYMDGYTATREIKKICPDIPVIAQTAYALEDDEARCRQAGCDDYMSKPIRQDVLLETVKRYIG